MEAIIGKISATKYRIKINCILKNLTCMSQVQKKLTLDINKFKNLTLTTNKYKNLTLDINKYKNVTLTTYSGYNVNFTENYQLSKLSYLYLQCVCIHLYTF